MAGSLLCCTRCFITVIIFNICEVLLRINESRFYFIFMIPVDSGVAGILRFPELLSKLVRRVNGNVFSNFTEKKVFFLKQHYIVFKNRLFEK